jgi:hypothetical protein
MPAGPARHHTYRSVIALILLTDDTAVSPIIKEPKTRWIFTLNAPSTVTVFVFRSVTPPLYSQEAHKPLNSELEVVNNLRQNALSHK